MIEKLMANVLGPPCKLRTRLQGSLVVVEPDSRSALGESAVPN